MDLLNNIIFGFGVALSPQNLLFCFFGALIGTLIGVLPGIGPLATLAMLLPATFYLPPVPALIMLAGIYYGAQYGGSTTAILVNVPGESASVVTCLDGHQMARKGRAGAALAIAALGSLFAGTVSTLIIAVASPPLSEFAIKFLAPEYFSLMVLGLVGSMVLARGSLLNAVAMVLLGLLLGLFGVAEILINLEQRDQHYVGAVIGSLMPTREEFRQATPAVLRGTALGSLLGILPGGGALLASFAAYAFEKKVAADPARFGKGAIEGVAAPESANNAGAQTSFIPLLTLGIPSNPVSALMVGAMIIHGIQPGPSVINEQPALFWGMIVSMWIGNLFLVVLNYPLIGMWVRMIMIPYQLLYPGILVFCAIGVFSLKNAEADIYFMALFGVLGYVFSKLGCEPAPMLLAFILGPLMEEYLRRAMLLSRGNPWVFVQRPISATLLALAVLAMCTVLIPAFSKTREEAFSEGAG